MLRLTNHPADLTYKRKTTSPVLEPAQLGPADRGDWTSGKHGWHVEILSGSQVEVFRRRFDTHARQ